MRMNRNRYSRFTVAAKRGLVIESAMSAQVPYPHLVSSSWCDASISDRTDSLLLGATLFRREPFQGVVGRSPGAIEDGFRPVNPRRNPSHAAVPVFSAGIAQYLRIEFPSTFEQLIFSIVLQLFFLRKIA
jgi:hypothetical protein